ncbi:MAG: methyltransferase domain-containing protein, partial [Dehalococcoidia bacterium]|nr:methyltransferase domain-containing protein [Dehalococcoidia bacterium]
MVEDGAWHEEDSFWETVRPVLFTARRWEETPREVEAMVSLLGLSPGARVLDLCCGVGRHSLEFARRGFQVMGVDRTATYLQEARRRAAEQDLQVEFSREDMRTFVRPWAFDAVINYCTSFGYFESEENDRRVLAYAHRSLGASGVLLMEMMGKEILARVFSERGWREEDGMPILEDRKLTPDWSTIHNRWIILEDGDRREVTLTTRLYSAAELSRLLKEAGLSKVDVYGDFSGAPYD